jgi:hypothetical protein
MSQQNYAEGSKRRAMGGLPELPSSRGLSTAPYG